MPDITEEQGHDITEGQMQQVAQATADRYDTDAALYLLADYFVADYKKDIARYYQDAVVLFEAGPDSARYCVQCGTPVISDDMDDSEVAVLYTTGEQLCEACEDDKLEA
jgi:hypothetical protein